jgi:multicomponent Na+:H+ antiporter subunit F
MDALLWALAVFLLLNILAGMVRVLRGPTPEDRLAASILFGTTGVAMLLVLAQATEEPALRDVALVFVLLAAVVTVVFGRQTLVGAPDIASDSGEHGAGGARRPDGPA